MRKKMFILLLINTVLIGFNYSATFASNITVEAQSSNTIWDFSIKVFSIAYPLFLLLCLYFIFYGIRRIQSLHHGGFVNSKDIEYCREIPKSVNLELAYTSLYYCSHINRKVLKKGILTAFILQWANEDNISITNRGKNIFSIDLKDGNFFKKDIEQELYNILKEAAGNNNVIDNNELKVWTSNNPNKLNNWYNHLLDKNKNNNLKPIAKYLLGLKKFLLDYSLIDERKHVEVKIWEEYLIYSNILGIADTVSREFKKIYPDYCKLEPISLFDFPIWAKATILYIFLLIPFSLALVSTTIITILYSYFIY